MYFLYIYIVPLNMNVMIQLYSNLEVCVCLQGWNIGNNLCKFHTSS